MKPLRIPPRMIAPVVVMISCPAAAFGDDTARFLSALSEAATISERSQICADLDRAEVPPFADLFCDGYLALVENQDSVATQWLEQSLALQPDFALGCVAYGEAYSERGDWRRAARWFARAREIAPQRVDAPFGLGRAYLELAKTAGPAAYERALEAFRAMTAISPKSPDGWANVGMVLARLGRYGEARRSYERALSLTPKDPSLHHGLGSLAAMEGNDAAAEASWKKALELEPAFAPAATELAALEGRRGRVLEAYAILERAARARQVGPEAGRVRRDLALLCLLAGETDRAVSLLEEARTLNPDARTLAALAHGERLRGSMAAASTALTQAAALDSSVAAVVRGAWSEKPGGGTPSPSEATAQVVSAFLPRWKLPPELKLPESTTPEVPYDTPPAPIYRALASYPEAAGGIEETIVVKVKIDVSGNVKEATVVTKGGNPALEWAALDAAKQWRFEPARLRGEPVEAEVSIPFRFTDTP